jgi:hypothetical protein
MRAKDVPGKIIIIIIIKGSLQQLQLQGSLTESIPVTSGV